MDEGAVIVLIAIAAAAGIVFIVASLRRQPRTTDDVDLDAIPFGSALVTGVLLSGVGFTILGESLVGGVIALTMGGVALVLAARMVLVRRSPVDNPVPTGELSRPAQDYLVWLALGVPVLMVAVFVVIAIVGGLHRR